MHDHRHHPHIQSVHSRASRALHGRRPCHLYQQIVPIFSGILHQHSSTLLPAVRCLSIGRHGDAEKTLRRRRSAVVSAGVRCVSL